MKTLLAIVISILFHLVAIGQGNTSSPKLVVGIVVDQMRFDHLYKHQDKYGEGGFKRLLNEGYNFKNAHYNYSPTVTAAGHASIYTGTTPSVHGMVGNSWFDRNLDRGVSNVGDSTATIVGSMEVNMRGVSPHRIMSTTISDQLRMAYNYQSKVISVSFKDRGAILPGGHTANGAYWHDWQTSNGYFVSSSHYMDSPPQWVVDFNESGKASKYLDFVWNPVFPMERYPECTEDDVPYERTFGGKPTPTFPYEFNEYRKLSAGSSRAYQMLWVSPAGNSLLTDFAMEAITQETLGADAIPDLINISYSVPDAAGHSFGPQSIEVADIYVRLDRELERLLNFLDERIGEDQYVLFLTSDHGVVPVASYLDANNLPTGIARITLFEDALNKYLKEKYGNKEWIQNFDGANIYLNREIIREEKEDLTEIQQAVADFMMDQDGIYLALTAHQLTFNEYRSGMRSMLQNGFHYDRSGDVLLAFDPGYVQHGNPNIQVSQIKGTGHGTGWVYDTHIPIVWKGYGIPQGNSVRKVAITDIASTLAMILNLQLPSGNTGQPLKELFNE
ncbi:MAG: alkaline phosphatase family protein [Saprospiraceae bacterium]|nr:alkaline phosphatase family protein [Saprospiraceae bacterium]